MIHVRAGQIGASTRLLAPMSFFCFVALCVRQGLLFAICDSPARCCSVLSRRPWVSGCLHFEDFGSHLCQVVVGDYLLVIWPIFQCRFKDSGQDGIPYVSAGHAWELTGKARTVNIRIKGEVWWEMNSPQLGEGGFLCGYLKVPPTA